MSVNGSNGYYVDENRKIVATPELVLCEPWKIIESTKYQGFYATNILNTANIK